MDQERGSVESLTLFPNEIYDAPISALDCSEFVPEGSPKPTAKVTVTSVQELPAPDTVAYLQRLEEEKRSRQHGAAQDNRSFLAKYVSFCKLDLICKSTALTETCAGLI